MRNAEFEINLYLRFSIFNPKCPFFFGTICALNTRKSLPEITGNQQQDVGLKQGDPRSVSGVKDTSVLCARAKA
jgi:hypothetical protein